jgi:hypothetical protein
VAIVLGEIFREDLPLAFPDGNGEHVGAFLLRSAGTRRARSLGHDRDPQQDAGRKWGSPDPAP